MEGDDPGSRDGHKLGTSAAAGRDQVVTSGGAVKPRGWFTYEPLCDLRTICADGQPRRQVKKCQSSVDIGEFSPDCLHPVGPLYSSTSHARINISGGHYTFDYLPLLSSPGRAFSTSLPMPSNIMLARTLFPNHDDCHQSQWLAVGVFHG